MRTASSASASPAASAGSGASYADYVRVSEEIGRYCGATGLTFNMHNATMLWCGQVADLLDLSPADRDRHEAIRTEMYRGVVEDGAIHSQPFSEGLAPGATTGVATRAVPVDGGWLVTGRKIFASLSGAATFYNVTCQSPGEDVIRLLGVPADAEGVQIVDDWDPLGMRGTVSRTLLMNDVFVPHANEWMPAGTYNQAALRYPWLFLSLCPSYLGLTGGILDTTAAYLRGELPGQVTGPRRDHAIKQHGWAQMQLQAPAEPGAALPGRRRGDDRPDRAGPRHRLGRRGDRDGPRRRGGLARHQGLRRPEHAEVDAAGAHVPRRPPRQHDAAVERRGVHRTARPGSPLRRGRRTRDRDHRRSPMSRATLTRDTIVDTTIRIIAEQGTEGFTMRSLGQALGTDPTAVYRHFRDKAELLRAVSERLLGTVTVDLPADAGWRPVTVEVCRRLRSALLNQPQLATALQFGPPLQPTEFAITETLLRQFRLAGLEQSAAALAYHSVIELTVGSAAIDAALHSLSNRERSQQYFRWRSVYATLDPAEYPETVGASAHLYRGTADERFVHALEALLDGIVPSP